MRQTFHIDFVKKSKIFFCFSLGIMLVCLILNIFVFPTLVDIQFTGGTIIKYSYSGDIKDEDIEKVIDDTIAKSESLKNDNISYSFNDNLAKGEQDNNDRIVSLQFNGNKAVSVEDKTAITEALENAFPNIRYTYKGDIKEDDIKKTVNDEVAKSDTLKEDKFVFTFGANPDSGSTDKNTNMVSMQMEKNTPVTASDRSTITSALQTAYPDGSFTDKSGSTFKEASSSSVDASKGANFFFKCLAAVSLAAVLMIFYVAIRFRKIGGLSAGVMAVVALIHDLIIVYFVFAMFRMPLNDNFIAVVLMILGYSLNDTIVIYDRIRELRKKSSPRTPIEDIVNTSLNQCMVRTICTSITTIIAIGSVLTVSLMYNIDSIVSFALPMMIGLISGSYSSLCIAAPLWVIWKKHQMKKKAEEKANGASKDKKSKKAAKAQAAKAAKAERDAKKSEVSDDEISTANDTPDEDASPAAE